jgi:DNA processing protein
MKIQIQDNEIEVFVKGDYLDKDRQAVAIVGTRKTSKRGEDMAYKFSYAFAKKGITIVSGLARGIDTRAHMGALAAPQGRTIAVLAHGLDRIYPAENRELADKIIKHGCLMTKFAEGTTPLPKNFLARNQIIAGLSKAVLVVEGERRSGSISTANHAANMGIEVFAIHGSPATDFLIENGADVVRTPEDILKYLRSIS